MTTNREKVLAKRQENPQMRAIIIAEEIGITRERVRQLLVELGLRTDIPEAPTRRYWSMPRGRGEHKPRPMVLPKPIEVTINAAPLPTVCTKCKAKFLYKEEYHGNWELKCFACGFIVAFGCTSAPHT